jgi:hypothetical protein
MDISTLPYEIRQKVFYYLRHRLADIAQALPHIKYKRFVDNHVHGSPFDRGGADCYYEQDCCPNNLTPCEIQEYHDGYGYWLQCHGTTKFGHIYDEIRNIIALSDRFVFENVQYFLDLMLTLVHIPLF